MKMWLGVKRLLCCWAFLLCPVCDVYSQMNETEKSAWHNSFESSGSEDISVKTYPLSEERFEPLEATAEVCYFEPKDYAAAEAAGLVVRELAVVELEAAYPGVPSLDPFVYAGKKKIRQLGGNAFSAESSFEYSISQKVKGAVLKAYRVEGVAGILIPFCRLGGWAEAGRTNETFTLMKAQADLSKTDYALEEELQGLEAVYGCVKSSFDKKLTDGADKFPALNAILSSSQTFSDCHKYYFAPKKSEQYECLVSSQQYVVELSSSGIDARACSSREILCKKLNQYRKSHPKEYEDYAKEYSRLYDGYPSCDVRKKPKLKLRKEDRKGLDITPLPSR